MDILVIAGRILYGGLMVYVGISNYQHLKLMAEIKLVRGQVYTIDKSIYA
jgi:hypothetical protein